VTDPEKFSGVGRGNRNQNEPLLSDKAGPGYMNGKWKRELSTL